jgi:hypothetical protein
MTLLSPPVASHFFCPNIIVISLFSCTLSVCSPLRVAHMQNAYNYMEVFIV